MIKSNHINKKSLFLLFVFSCFFQSYGQPAGIPKTTNVLIIGGGASGTMAGIQSARMGVSTIIIEGTPWLGGMLTSAGVSAIDGNYKLPSGLWEEFRQNLNTHYGGADNLKTGWVSNVLFEPQVGAKILAEMTAKEEHLAVFLETKLSKIEKTETGWKVVVLKDNVSYTLTAHIIIDATELGDVSKQVGIPYDIGMDSRKESGEDIAPEIGNTIIQDLTYVVILKDFGKSADVTIPRPIGYDPSPFLCACNKDCEQEISNRKLWDCDEMIKYGKLPNGYYMINWPINGNDFYLNLIESSPEERVKELEKAKEYTLSFVYYLQTELGFGNLGIADDVYPTKDGLPFIPYHRESRRIKGLVRFNVNDVSLPFDQKDALYRTGIAVGDYPVDHHHHAYPNADSLPDLHFYPVPSYSLPLGTLIPEKVEGFIVAEKSISVSNIVNGTTRLQPVCLLIGQASGMLAALSVKNNTSPRNVLIRQLQKELINAGAYLMPYSDIMVTKPEFNALQRVGATGILKGEGKNIGWENHTYIYPDSLLRTSHLKEGLHDWLPTGKLNYKNEFISYKEVFITIIELQKMYGKKLKPDTMNRIKQRANKILIKYNLPIVELKSPIKRSTFAILIDEILNPFELRNIDHYGNFIH
jgi:hypothetical protein